MIKIRWAGRIVSVQPRIGLTRSFDERYHRYSGYCLFLNGIVGDEEREFSVGIGKVVQAKHQFQAGDEASGEAVPVADPRKERAEFYRASKLRLLVRATATDASPPPWHGVPPDLETYRGRGHRRLAARTYDTRCKSCKWGCRMPVTMIIDQWEPEKKRYRYETFCYGPKSCSFYRPGPTRKVPGRKGMTWEEEDWVDEQATAHRERDE
jgi:hypothetical protein